MAVIKNSRKCPNVCNLWFTNRLDYIKYGRNYGSREAAFLLLVKTFLVFHFFYYSFHISSDFKSLILEVDVLLESLLDTSPYIFKCSGLGAPRGRRSMAFVFAEDMSDSEELILFKQGCRLKYGYTGK